MLEHLNIQAIAKWFEKGCDNLENDLTNKTGGDKGFYILECNDICLLSKLADVKNKTLLDRAYKRLKKIKDPMSKKDFLLAISNEFLRDGRKIIPLKMITSEIENETELFRMFAPDLFFHRALCYFKLDKPTDALCDLYSGFQSTQIQSLDRIHVQILEEIKKYLKNNKFREGHILTKDNSQVSFSEILHQYETEICSFIKQKMEKQKKEEDERIKEEQPFEGGRMHYRGGRNFRSHLNKFSCRQVVRRNTRHSLSGIRSSKLRPKAGYGKHRTLYRQCVLPSYKSKLLGQQHGNCSTGRPIKRRTTTAATTTTTTTANNGNNKSYSQITESGGHVGVNKVNKFETNPKQTRELNITYSVDNQKQISVKQILDEPIIDNIFNLRAILVGNLFADYKINTLCEIFQLFGTIINIKYKENTDKLIIEYDNGESSRLAISYLSKVELPFVTANNKYLEFRFYKSENQKNLRICKQNQIKTSRECYFWRTTGCQNINCKFFHNRLAKGVDYQEWMKTELSSCRGSHTKTTGSGTGGVGSDKVAKNTPQIET